MQQKYNVLQYIGRCMDINGCNAVDPIMPVAFQFFRCLPLQFWSTLISGCTVV